MPCATRTSGIRVLKIPCRSNLARQIINRLVSIIDGLGSLLCSPCVLKPRPGPHTTRVLVYVIVVVVDCPLPPVNGRLCRSVCCATHGRKPSCVLDRPTIRCARSMRSRPTRFLGKNN